MKIFNEKEKKDKILIILTDGEAHSKNVKKLVKESQIKEIKIFTIGIGKKYREIIPIRDNNVKKLLNVKNDKNCNIVKT